MRLRAEMYAAMAVADHDPAWRTNALAWFRRRVDDPDYGIFVVEDGGEVVACAMAAIRDAAPSPAAPSGRDVLISNVCTAPGSRGRGFGRAVFEAALEWARETGVQRAELMATDGGRGIYERAGFAVTQFPAMRVSLA